MDGLTQVALDSMAAADLRKAVKDEFEASSASIVVERFSTNRENLEGRHPRDWVSPFLWFVGGALTEVQLL